MAVPKATISRPPAQPQSKSKRPSPNHQLKAEHPGPNHQLKAEHPGPNHQLKAEHPGPNHQLKAEFFEALRHLNRGYGVALSSLERLEAKDHLHKPRVFPAGFLASYRNRTESLRSQANRDLLRLLAGREEHEAERFNQLSTQAAKRLRNRRSL